MTCDFHIHSKDFNVFRFNSKTNNMTEIKKLVKKIVDWKDKREGQILKDMKKEEQYYYKYTTSKTKTI